MEKPNHKSIRDSDWHPRQQSEAYQFIPEPEGLQTLGLFARTELKQRITILFPPEKVEELIRKEGVNPEDYKSHF